jgi:hypothetical protein
VFPMNSPCVSKTPKMFPTAIHFLNIWVSRVMCR